MRGGFVLLCALWLGRSALPSSGLLTDEAPGAAAVVDDGVALRVDLIAAEFTRNGKEPADDQAPRLEPGLDGDGLHLPFDARGVRWAVTFSTDAAATHRLLLDWEPDARGVLFEVVLDGERQSPPRDGWRPTRRRLTSDLGPRWLGEGEHLLEFVAREEPDGVGGLTLRALELSAP